MLTYRIIQLQYISGYMGVQYSSYTPSIRKNTPMPLTDIKIKSAKPTDKPYKLTDGDGMFLLVHSNGGKYWRMKYRYAGKEKVLALGVYPETSLSDARDRRFNARKILAGGVLTPAKLKRKLNALFWLKVKTLLSY